MNEGLTYLARAYFHQDYQLDYETPAAAIRDFRVHESPELLAALLAEIEGVLAAAPSEAGLRDLWATQSRSSYLPEYSNLTYRQWFEQMREILLGADPVMQESGRSGRTPRRSAEAGRFGRQLRPGRVRHRGDAS